MTKKQLQGIVISDQMNKTAVVSVEKVKIHVLYGKRMRRHVNYKAHNELGAKKNDLVTIEEHQPISKDKKWIIKEIIKK